MAKSFFERTVSAHNSTMESLVKASSKQYPATPGFKANDSMMPPEFTHIDIHKRNASSQRSADRFVENWLRTSQF